MLEVCCHVIYILVVNRVLEEGGGSQERMALLGLEVAHGGHDLHSFVQQILMKPYLRVRTSMVRALGIGNNWVDPWSTRDKIM